MTQSDQSNTELRTVLGRRVAQEGEHVEDMGRRVAEQLALQPRDNFYAGEKLSSALRSIVYALAMMDWPEETIAAIVSDAHGRGIRFRRDIARELREESYPLR